MGSLYSEHRTWLHKVPAWLKLLLLVVCTGLQYGTSQLNALGWGTALVVLGFVTLGRAVLPARRLLLGLALACVLLLAFHGWMQQWEVGFLSTLRLLSASLMGIALTVSTRSGELLAVLETLLSPLQRLGLRTERLALMLSLMLRFTEHFFVVWKRLDDAHRVRTGKAGGLRLLAPLTIHMLTAAKRVADTLELRLGP